MSARVINKTGWSRRKARVRKKVRGTEKRPRLNVYRSNRHIYAQVVIDTTGSTVASASTLSKELAAEAASLSKVDAARKVGELIGRLARDKGVESVVFDRSGYLYHGRVRAVAEGAREAGLKF
ncbi:MAG TPA: 50S ribosomal protein L18 [Deltaproteobacteria bacterium]|nr:50S ribosomal protein L18 [Deltaproteobacteria bacterium]